MKHFMFPIIENNILKPKIEFEGDVSYVSEEQDAYGYTFKRWDIEPPVKIKRDGKEIIIKQAITYKWQGR